MVFIYGDRFRSNIEAAIPTAGIHPSHPFSSYMSRQLLVLKITVGSLFLAQLFASHKRDPAFYLCPATADSSGFFLEQRLIHSLSISFIMLKIRCFRKFVFLYTAFAICLYVPRTSIFPKGSRSGCSSFWDVLLGHVTFTFTDVFNGFGSGCFTGVD